MIERSSSGLFVGRLRPASGLAGRSVRGGLGLLVDSRPILLVVLNLALILFMAITAGARFFSTANLASVALDTAQSGILAVGMMILLIGGAVDLSIGAVLALAGVTAAMAMRDLGMPAGPAWFVGLLTGGVCGVINGLIVARLRINTLITTLATMGIFRGVSQLLSGTGVTSLGNGFESLGQGVLLQVQYPFWILAALVVLFTFLTRRSQFFRQFYFIGGNERAARLSGIAADRVIFLGFVLMGVLSGLAGVLTASRLNSAVISAGQGVELKVITAVVLGGAALTGGAGSIPGSFLGVLFISLMQNALIISKVNVFWQQIVIGVVLIIAVSTDYIARRRT
ncbi:MAG: ABC transporter permease [Chloroflexi bacterium]|nr:ABC transporter permease [Chloroflexota bacterium]MBV9544394.1 ABC transporter permease [Chloroflexota bacterium]